MSSDAPIGSDREEAVELVRREERLRAGTRTVPVERVRVERVVVTEQRTVTVDVSHEEFRITREPVLDDHVASSAEAAPRAPLVIVLREEQVVVTKNVVPVERVTVHVDVVAGEEQVSGTVAQERIDYTPPAP